MVPRGAPGAAESRNVGVCTRLTEAPIGPSVARTRQYWGRPVSGAAGVVQAAAWLSYVGQRRVPAGSSISASTSAGPRLRAHHVPDVNASPMPQPRIGKIGQKKPTPVTHQMPTSMRLTVT